MLAISADEGTLRDNVRERLQDLDMGNSPYFLVLTKSEKRAEADIKEICSHLCETVTSCIGKPPEKLIITSARKKQVEELRLAINKIQQTEEDKKSSVDSKVLAKNIDEHIKFLQKNVDYIDDVAIDVSDNVLDDFEWGILESHFDGLPYKWAKSRAESVVFRGEASFREAIKKNIAGKFSNPSQEILKDLKNLEILPPDSNISEKALSTFSSLTTKRLNVAIKKASPYFFESENDDTTGARISSRFRDMRDEFRKDVRYCAYIYLEEWIKSQIAGWERIRNLISN